MRHQLLKLTKGKSTKSERIFMEALKDLHIPFRTKVRINGCEVDFLVHEKYAVEIDGHEQSSPKNTALIEKGFIPMHFHNDDIKNNRERIKEILKCLLRHSSQTE